MSIAFTTGWLEEFYSGAGIADSAGTAYPVSLGGVAYEVNTYEPGSQSRYEFSHASVPQQRVALDDRDNASRGTLNPEAFWRRTFESWHVGAGQSHFDRVDESNPFRFRRSKGIDVWDRYQVSLLQAVDGKNVSGNTNLFLAVAGDFLYLTNGTALQRTADITPGTPTWTTITGGTAATFTSIASDGFNVLLACGASGIDKTTRGAATKANHITGTVDLVFNGKGRWMAAAGPILYDITTVVAGGGALPAALFTHPNTDWDWTCFAEGPSAIYAAGTSGDKSLIYRLTMKEDGTGLNQPVAATPGFPDGETVHSMQGYLGFVLVGTSKGVRIGVVGGNGDLTIGALIETDTPVQCFEGQDRFVWFGWTNYEAVSSGLGRIDLQTFSDPEGLAPAYASDLMADNGVTGAVQSVVTFQNLRVFTTSGTAVWAEDPDNLVASGQIDSGTFDFGLTDSKLSLYLDSAHAGPHGGSHTFYLSVDGGAFGSLGDPGQPPIPLATGEARGNDFEIRAELTRDSVDTDEGPTLTMWALRAQPVAPITEQIVVPLRIAPTITRSDGVVENVDPNAQVEHIVSLCRTKGVVQYVEGVRAWSVVVSDYQLDVHDVWIGDDASLGVKGTCLVQMKTVVG